MAEDTNKTPSEEPRIPNQAQDDLPAFHKRFADAYYRLLNYIYALVYLLGLRLLRMFYKRKRRFLRHWQHYWDNQAKRRDRRRHGLKSRLRAVWWELTAPAREVKRKYHKLMQELESERRYGTDLRVAGVYWRMAWFALKKFWQLGRFLFNYIAPVAACIFLYTTAQHYMSQTYALQLTYDGIDMGYISDESVFNQANQEMRNRMANEEYFSMPQITPRFELVIAPPDELLRVDELTNMLIQHSGSNLLEASGLYMESTVNGRTQMKLMGAVKDGRELLLYLNSLLEENRTPDMGEDAQIQFVKKMQLKKGLYPQSAIRTIGEITEELGGLEKQELRYTVVPGDTPLRIAAKNGISFEELKLLNPTVEESLFPGDELLISQSVSRMSVKVTTRERVEQEVAYNIKQETLPSMDIGWTNLKQKGSEGLEEVYYEVVLVDSVEVSRTEVVKNILKEPVDEILQVGGNRPLSVIPKTSAGGVPSGTFAWPTVGGWVSVGFRGYYGHTGTDIQWPGCYGYPIYASAEGVVVVAKMYGGAYGNYVVIDHGGGIQTLYAHCSRLDVKVGDVVKQGQQIAAIGSTGRSTGPHVHFEIIKNGTPVDAMPYLTR